MNPITSFLHLCARNGRWVLVAGLFTGIFIQPLAELIQPYVGHVVAVLLFLAALRIKPSEAVGKLSDLRNGLTFIGVFQILVPCAVALVFLTLGASGPLIVATLLVLSSAPISASPSLTLITGNNPAPALRILIISTAALPFTVILPFSLLPVFGDTSTVFWIAVRLFFIIFIASALAFALRTFAVKELSDSGIKSIDGMTSLLMATIVTGLMAGFAEAAINNPLEIVLTLCVAVSLNIGMQIVSWHALGPFNTGDSRAAYAISAGNRNLAIFLAALPVAVTEPILIFIACYQIPMYLTPSILGKMYGKSIV